MGKNWSEFGGMSRALRVDHSPGFNMPENTYTVLLCEALQRLGVSVRDYAYRTALLDPPNVVHIHWPEFGLNLKDRSAAKKRLRATIWTARLLRLRGVRVFWTAHNLRPHENDFPDLEAWFYRTWPSVVDGIICLSDSSRAMLNERYPATAKIPTYIIPHGHYCDSLDPTITRESARAELGLPADANVISLTGTLREYKNVPLLIELFGQLKDPKAVLDLAGSCPVPEFGEQLTAMTSATPNVHLKMAHLSDHEFQSRIVAANLVVVPYLEILNSGTALYALSCGRPCLLPAIGSMTELASQVGPGWIQLFEPPFELSHLERAVEWSRQNRPQAPDLTNFDWNLLAKAHVAAYASAI